jgi:hypothetical protein
MTAKTKRFSVFAIALCIAAASAGCNQIFGINETTLSETRAYSCDCVCTGGGQSFDVNNNVCTPESLNPALNPNLPSDFVPGAADLQNDCHTRVERNLEQMSHQCVSPRIRCTCEAQANLNSSFGQCDTPCFGDDLKADCSNFDPQTGNVTATNVPGQQPVCVVNFPNASSSAALAPAPFAAALFGRTTQCEVSGAVTVTRDGDTKPSDTTGVAQFQGDPCPGGSCAVGVSYLLDHVDSFSFSDFGGFASVEFKDIGASGASEPAAAVLDDQGVGVLPETTLRNTGKGKRSNQVLGGEVSSDSAAFTGGNPVPLGVVVDWSNHGCALTGAVLGSLEDSATRVDVDLVGTIVNEPPTASAGATRRTVECTSPAGADVALDGSASTDPESNIALVSWHSGSRTGPEIGSDPVVHVAQALGSTQSYSLTVVDALGQSSQDTATVAVVDTTPPAITQLAASPNKLWPPNHKMVPITVTASSTDVCGAATCAISGVTSSEPTNGHGDGNTDADWQITGPTTVQLRAERAGGSAGRVYTIEVRCSDAAGNASVGTTTVTVTH